MAYLYEVRISKERGGVPHKVMSVEKLLSRLSEGSEIATGDFKKGKNFVTKKCAYCDEDFKPVHPRIKYCVKENVLLKDQCRTKAELKKRRAGKFKLPFKNCALCKKEFQPLRENHFFCNQPCNTILMQREINREKVYKCKSCKKEFSTTKKNARVYCGSPCTYVLAYNEKKKQKTLAKYENQKCKLCGKIIVGAKRKRIFCNDPCRYTKKNKKILRLKEKLS